MGREGGKERSVVQKERTRLMDVVMEDIQRDDPLWRP